MGSCPVCRCGDRHRKGAPRSPTAGGASAGWEGPQAPPTSSPLGPSRQATEQLLADPRAGCQPSGAQAAGACLWPHAERGPGAASPVLEEERVEVPGPEPETPLSALAHGGPAQSFSRDFRYLLSKPQAVRPSCLSRCLQLTSPPLLWKGDSLVPGRLCHMSWRLTAYIISVDPTHLYLEALRFGRIRL